MPFCGGREELEKRSNGSIKMDFVSGGALGGDQELLQQLATNEIQMHVAGPVIVHRLLKEYQCLEAEYVFATRLTVFAFGMVRWGRRSPTRSRAIRDRDRRGRRTRCAPCHLQQARPRAGRPEGIKLRVTNNLRAQIFVPTARCPGPCRYPSSTERCCKACSTRRRIRFQRSTAIVCTRCRSSSTSRPRLELQCRLRQQRFLAGMDGEHRKVFDETLKEAIDWLNQAVAKDTDTLFTKMKAERGTATVRPNVEAFRAVALPIVEKFATDNCRSGLLEDIRTAAK